MVNGQLRLNYQILPNLNIQGRAALRQKTILQEMKVPKTYMNYGDSREGDYKVWNDRQTNVDADVLATYTQDLTPDILFTLNAGTSVFYRNYRQEYQSTDGLIVPFVYSIKTHKVLPLPMPTEMKNQSVVFMDQSTLIFTNMPI